MFKKPEHFILLALPLLVGATIWLWPGQPQPSLVLRESMVRAESELPEAQIAKRFRHVQINPNAIAAVQQGGQIVELELFRGEKIRVQLEPSEQTGLESSEAHGSIVGVPGSMVSMVTYDGAVAATVQYPDGRSFMVNYAGGGDHSIVELDNAKLETPDHLQVPHLENPLPVSPDGTVTAVPQLQFGVTNRVPGFPQFTHTLMQTNPWPTQVPLGPINYGPPIVGILVLYTPTAKRQCGGRRGVEARIRLSVAQVNAAFKRSLVTAKLTLLGTEEIEYTTTGQLYPDLINLTYGRTPALRYAHSLRQEYRADLVSLFIGGTADIFHGISWMLNSTRPAPHFGFNVVEGIYAPTSVFAHEIGHNLGCSHATNDIGGYLDGVYTNSHGWRFSTTNRGRTYPMRTIMAYGAGPRLGYYSTPRVSIWGSPAGNAAFADNANTISNTAPMVGAYMTEIIHVQKLVPNATAQPMGSSTITLLPNATSRSVLRRPRRSIRLFFGGD